MRIHSFCARFAQTPLHALPPRVNILTIDIIMARLNAMDDPQQIIDRVFAEAERQGLNLTGLAQKAGVGRANLSRWKTNGGEVGHLVFGKVAEALGKSADWAYGLDAYQPARAEIKQERARALLKQLLKAADMEAPQTPIGPTLAEFLAWYQNVEGEICLTDDICEFFDIYGDPRERGGNVWVLRLGAYSVATKTIGTSSPAAAEAMIEANAAFCRQTANDHVRVFEGEAITDERSGNWRRPDGADVANHFLRGLRRASWGGQRIVVSGTQLISAAGEP